MPQRVSNPNILNLFCFKLLSYFGESLTFVSNCRLFLKYINVLQILLDRVSTLMGRVDFEGKTKQIVAEI